MLSIRRKRKASLQLSINAIVILILAITILGLGLGFIRGQWGKLEKDLDKVSDQMKEQIEEDIRSSGKILTFNKLEINAKKGEEVRFYYGLKNTGDDACFGVALLCIQSQKVDASDETNCPGSTTPVVVGGLSSSSSSWFSLFETVEIEGGDVAVMPIVFQVSDANADTYQMRILVWDDETGCGLIGGSGFDPVTTDVTPYAKKDFHIFLE